VQGVSEACEFEILLQGWKNGHTDVCLFVCWYVDRTNGNPNPCTNLDEIFHALPHLSKECFGPLTPWAWGA